MKIITIILSLLVLIIFFILIYIFFLNNKSKPKVKEMVKTIIKQLEPKQEEIIIEEIVKEDQIGLYRYQPLSHDKKTNVSISINPTLCKNLVMDYDEINLNSIKNNHFDKIMQEHENDEIIKIDNSFSLKDSMPINSEEKSEFNFMGINKKYNVKELKYVNTYLNLPGYKAYNIVDTNKYELAKNNTGLINYVKLKPTEAFKAYNSLAN